MLPATGEESTAVVFNFYGAAACGEGPALRRTPCLRPGRSASGVPSLFSSQSSQGRKTLILAPHATTCRSRAGWRSAPPPGFRRRRGRSAPPPGSRERRRGGATATFEVPIPPNHTPVQFKALSSRRGHSCPPCQDHVTEQTPLTCSSKLLCTSTTSTSLSPSPGRPIILVRKHPDWYFKFYIRRDRSGSFNTYPDVSGPFTSVEEAENAIDRYLGGLEHEMMCKDSLDKLSPREWLIQRSLYWPDGKKRKYSEAFASENTRTGTGHLLQALVDKYNEDHNLFGDLAYELKDVLHYQTMCACESNIWYYHFNFTTTTKGADGIEKIFFAEVTRMVQNELVINCFCMINPDANGPCYGCKNDGNVGMKHPNDAKTYNAGHTDGYLRFEHSPVWDPSDDDDDDVKDDEDRVIFKDDEDRLRFIYKGLDDPEKLKEIFTSLYATPMFIEE